MRSYRWERLEKLSVRDWSEREWAECRRGDWMAYLVAGCENIGREKAMGMVAACFWKAMFGEKLPEIVGEAMGWVERGERVPAELDHQLVELNERAENGVVALATRAVLCAVDMAKMPREAGDGKAFPHLAMDCVQYAVEAYLDGAMEPGMDIGKSVRLANEVIADTIREEISWREFWA